MTEQAAVLQLALPAGRYLMKARLQGKVRGPSFDGEQDTSIVGELEYMVTEVGESEAVAQWTRIGLIGPPVDTREGGTGRISIHAGQDTGGKLVREGDGWYLTLTREAELLYESLQNARPREQDPEHDTFDTPSESVGVILNGMLTPPEEPVVETEFAQFSGDLVISYREGGLNRIDQITLPFQKARVYYLGGDEQRIQLESIANEIVQSQQELLAANLLSALVPLETRTIRLQPVIFAASSEDPSPTGRTLTDQLTEANRLWEQGCIRFVAEEPHRVNNAGLKTSDDYSALVDSFVVLDASNQKEPNVIEIYFVDNDLLNDGGGYTRDGKSGLAKVFISDRNDMAPLINPRVLAHELGHVLSLSHPDENNIGYSAATADSLMEADVPNPDLNTLHNCLTGSNPAQDTSTQPDCLPTV